MTTTVNPTPLPKAVRNFHTCEQCTYDLLEGTGERACNYFECPYLPEALNTVCPTCRYDFAICDGNPECSDPPTCSFAREVAPIRLATLRQWRDERRTIPG